MRESTLKILYFVSVFLTFILFSMTVFQFYGVFKKPSLEEAQNIPFKYVVLAHNNNLDILFPTEFDNYILTGKNKEKGKISGYYVPKSNQESGEYLKDNLTDSLDVNVYQQEIKDNKSKAFYKTEGTNIYKGPNNSYYLKLSKGYVEFKFNKDTNPERVKSTITSYIKKIKYEKNYTTTPVRSQKSGNTINNSKERTTENTAEGDTETAKSNSESKSSTFVKIETNITTNGTKTTTKKEEYRVNNKTNTYNYYCVEIKDITQANSYKCYSQADYNDLNKYLTSYRNHKAGYEYNSRVYDMYKKAYEECDSDGCRDLYKGPIEEAKDNKDKAQEKYQEDLNKILTIVSRGVAR